jgi:hypothetical protein
MGLKKLLVYEMEGYIQYSKYSIYSPEYPYKIGRWNSPAIAIQQGQDIDETILLFVSLAKDTFYPMRNYIFSGLYSDYINKYISLLYKPRDEEINIDAYVYPIETPNIRGAMTVRRNIYQLRKAGDNLYRQLEALPITEVYSLGAMSIVVDGNRTEVPVYIGKEGSFLLFYHIPTSINTDTMTVGSPRVSCSNRMLPHIL